MNVPVNQIETSLDKMKPWLWVPPSISHEWMDPLLKSLCFFDESFQTEIWKTWSTVKWNSKWKNFEFKNPLGIAGGVDKTANCIQQWWTLGAGFVEVGTITPYFQSPNPGKIIDRDVKSLSLWNKMGFPHPGYSESLNNLEKNFANRSTPILVNIGKNRWTPNEKAHEDYIFLIEKLHQVTDIFVINISSPNTSGLRELFQKERLKPFLCSIYEAAQKYQKPVILKISPDEAVESLNVIIDVSLDVGIDGFIVSNTTTQRDSSLPFPKDGGVSGKYLAPLSKQALKLVVSRLGSAKKDKLIITAGGIASFHDIEERQALGADLFQIYSSLVFNGPYVFKKIARDYFLKYT